VTDHQGRFCWYELMTTDAGAAGAFYGKVVGWTPREATPGNASYYLLMAGETGAGGLMTLPQEALDAGARPLWIGYIAVADVDAYAVRVTDAGGAVHRQAEDIPHVGRFAVVSDPQGAHFVLFKPSVDGLPLPLIPTESGFFGWRELWAGDGVEAFAFYSKLFGWAKGEAIDMGPMGVYQLFTDGEHDVAIGGMMTKSPDIPSPMWNYYAQVDSVEEAGLRLKAEGGSILMGPHQVPGGNWIVQALDPQGGLFCLTSLKP
jgi:predicted enzyme related to lactoylglutathione lyase